MTDQGRHPEPTLDDFVDRQLSDAQRQAFAQRLLNDASLREALQCQEAIDAALTRLYAAPAASPTRDELLLPLRERAGNNGQVPGSDLQTAGRTREKAAANRQFQSIATMELKPRHLALAAMIALAVVIGWQLWPRPQRPVMPGMGGGGYSYMMARPQTAHAFYVAQVSSGFTPAWECPPEMFAQISRERFSESLTYSPPAPHDVPHVEMLGATYANIISTSTITMLVRVEGEPVVVLVDRVEADAGQTLPRDSGLYAHKRQIGKLVVYEISPLDKPCALPFFHPAPQDFPPLSHAQGHGCAGRLRPVMRAKYFPLISPPVQDFPLLRTSVSGPTL